MGSTKYRVRLVRPVFQVAVLEVEADGEEDAVFRALTEAEILPETEWQGEFDPENYFYDVQSVAEADNGEDDGYVAACLAKELKYLLLKADTDSGEGGIGFHPWLFEVGPLMTADLCSDWISYLQELEEEGVKDFYESLEQQLESNTRGPAKVLPFRRPVKDQD